MENASLSKSTIIIANLWQWLDKAVYPGRKEWIDHELDVWEAEVIVYIYM